MIKSYYFQNNKLPNAYKSLECAETFRRIWRPDTIDEFESFYVFYLNSKNEHIFTEEICIGNYSHTCFDPRRVIHFALYYKSPSFIMAHNHTNGLPNPSKDDIEITNKMLFVLNVLEIKLIDHIILTPESYFSFHDSGLLKINNFKKTG